VNAAATLPAATRMGRVDLTVSDADAVGSFYEEVVGLPPTLGLVGLHEDPEAPSPDPRATGLFHLAILVPTRRDLALALVRLGRARRPLTGASDHLVSEALYLNDPEGNGIEVYRDRPRSEWPRTESGWRIDTLPLDLNDILGELDGDPGEVGPMPDGTVLGHVHLKVADVPATEAFYTDVIGFDVMARVPSASFISAGEYHHHLGMNAWQSRGGPTPAPGSLGLRSYEVVLPEGSDVDAVHERLEAAGAPAERSNGQVATTDPSGNRLVIRAA
jgi:catechol 2,3-dioxygenase